MFFLQMSGWIHIGRTQNDHQTDSPGAATVAADSQTSVAAFTGEPSLATMQAQIQTLQQELAFAASERDQLRQTVDAINTFQTNQDERFLPGAVSDDAATSAASADLPNNTTGRGGNRNGAATQTQYDGLITAGVDPGTAVEIKQRSDQWALDRLDLIDTASREGWRDSDEFAEKMRELREQRVDIRSEIGDTAYDGYLYAAGESNRVQIQSIIDGSAAQVSGMTTGDIVLAYADALIYTSRELQNATRDGIRGELVSVSVLRSGRTLNLAIPRGPLGVTLSGISAIPQQ